MKNLFDFNNLTIVDLTHSLSSVIPGWNNGCGFKHKIEIDYADCDSEVKFRVQNLQMHAGIGTHMDAPAHCVPNAASIADIPLQSLIAPSMVCDVSNRAHERYQVTKEDIEAFELEQGKITKGMFIIIYTGWEQWWTQPQKYRNELIFPSVSKEAAEILLSRDIVGLGIDTLSPDTGDSAFPVHKLMLNAGKYIVENIANCKAFGTKGYIIALPIKIQNGTEAPIRLIGIIENRL